jgi:hypothetical protein
LQPDAAYAAVQRQGRDSGDALTVTATTLRKRLHERGLLKSTDQKRQVLTVRRTLASQRRDVLHLQADSLSPLSTEPDQPDHQTQKPLSYAEYVPPLWSGIPQGTRPSPDHESDQGPCPGSNGRVSDDLWSDHKARPDQKPDQQEPFGYAENSEIGRVGRVFDKGREKDSGEGAHTRRVRGQI